MTAFASWQLSDANTAVAAGVRQAARAAVQAAQVIEARLSRYGTITTDLPAAPASVVVCCAAHCQLLEACQAGASYFGLLDYTLPVHVLIHGRARLPQHP